MFASNAQVTILSPQRDLGWSGYAASRPAIERALRRRVEGQANITMRQRCQVVEVLASPDGAIVTGVLSEDEDGTSHTMAADLVVDASGRGAPTLSLLRSIGYPLPEETTIGIDLSYATSIFAVSDGAARDWKGVMTFGDAPQDSRGGLMLPLEGDRWMLTLARRGDALPCDTQGFLAFARSLRTPTIYDAICRAKPLDEVARYGFPESVRRHFERLEGFPRGLLPVGDAVCRFNPVYGQGMSVAALEACLLKRLLDRTGQVGDPIAELAPRFFAELQALLETPWSVAMLDFVFPDTRGQRPADFAATLNSVSP